MTEKEDEILEDLIRIHLGYLMNLFQYTNPTKAEEKYD